jgi:hypothetical protein
MSDNSSEQCVALYELSLLNCPQVSEDIRFVQSKKRTTETPTDGWIRSKRQRGRLRHTKLRSEPYDSPRSSRRSTPSVTVLSLDSNENGINNSDGIECLPPERARRYRDLSHNDIENKLDEKVRSGSYNSCSYRTSFKY